MRVPLSTAFSEDHPNFGLVLGDALGPPLPPRGGRGLALPLGYTVGTLFGPACSGGAFFALAAGWRTRRAAFA